MGGLKMVNIVQNLIHFIEINNISNRTIFDRTGISISNIKLIKSNSSYGFSTSLLTRFIAAFREDGIIEYIFADMPEISQYVFKQPVSADLLFEDDIVQFATIMRGLWMKDGESYFTLLDIFFILKCLASCTKRNIVFPGPITIDDMQKNRKSLISTLPFIEDDLSSFFQTDANENESLYSYSEIFTNYPTVTYDFFDKMLENGEAVTWTDIAALITKLQNDSKIGVDRLNKIIGLSASTIIRLEIQRTKSYNLDDIIKIDDYFHLEGKLLVLCIRASQNSYITTKIIDDIDSQFINPDKKQYRYERDLRNTQLTKALTSFIRMIRFIEQQNGYTGYFNSFIHEYRRIPFLYSSQFPIISNYLNDYSSFLSTYPANNPGTGKKLS